MLPPFVVTETNGLQWNYYDGGAFEVLAACNRSLAEVHVQRMILVERVMAHLLPARFRSVIEPEVVILMGEGFDQKKAREEFAAVMKRREFAFAWNLLLTDNDLSAKFAVVSSSTVDRFGYTPERVRQLLEECSPRLPTWFIEGFVGFYDDVSIAPNGRTTLHSLENSRVLPRANKIKLVPMADFFARQAGAQGESEWRTQATLFVRWAMFEDDGELRRRLWTFLDRLEHEPLSETLFLECFDRTYSRVRDELIKHAETFARSGDRISIPRADDELPDRPKFRAASVNEIARLLGSWERLEMAYVRQLSPDVTEKYLDLARKTISHAYDRGDRDPRLVAALGLAELDAGKPERAIPLLEQAARLRVVRPRIYFELGRLRLGKATTEAGAQGKIPAAQITEVLSLVSEGLKQQPSQLSGYILYATAVARKAEPASETELATMFAGAETFPHVGEYVLRVIYLHLFSGNSAKAAELAELGIRHTQDPTLRAKYERAIGTFRGEHNLHP